MNGAYLHLVVNHIPVVGVPLMVVLLVAGMIRKSSELVRTALAGFVLLAVVDFIAFQTGGPAAKTLFQYPGAAVERAAIHTHEEAAEAMSITFGVLGGLSLIGLWLSFRLTGIPKWLSGLLLVVGLMVSVALGRVAHLGGLIRHPEIVSATAPATVPVPDSVPVAPAPVH